MEYLIYHESDSKKPYKPQEDYYLHSLKDGIFAVADGVTHDMLDPIHYPMPSDSYEVARIVCQSVVDNLQNKPYDQDSIVTAYKLANKKVEEFNLTRDLYKNRKTNGYMIGATTAAATWIKENRLLYGVVDDCYISVFSEDLVDHPILKSYVDHSAKYLDGNFDWSLTETKRYWREDVRNHKIIFNDVDYGYGSIDGREGFEPYLQLGEVTLKSGDLVCVYTDGFIKLIQNMEFIKTLRDQPFTIETYDYIEKFAKNINQYKEKTCYFIKII